MKHLLLIILLLAIPGVHAQSVDVSIGADGHEVVALVNDTDEVLETAAICYTQASGVPMFIWSPTKGRLHPGSRLVLKAGPDPKNAPLRASEYSVCMVVRESKVLFLNPTQKARVQAYFEESDAAMKDQESTKTDHPSFRQRARRDAQRFRDSMQIYNVLRLLSDESRITITGPDTPKPDPGRADAKGPVAKEYGDAYGCSYRYPTQTWLLDITPGPGTADVVMYCQCANWNNRWVSAYAEATTACANRDANASITVWFETFNSYASITTGSGWPIADASGATYCQPDGDWSEFLWEPLPCGF